MNYTRILFTITLAGVATSSYAMLRETEVVWVLKENANPCAPKRETHAVYVLREDAHPLPELTMYDAFKTPLDRWYEAEAAKKISYKEKLKKLQKDLEKETQDCRGNLDFGRTLEYNAAFADIALNSDDMPALEKLEYLLGAYRYKHRKEIIVSLINSGENLNQITYQGVTALEDGINHADVDLITFLLETGVKPLLKDVKKGQQSACDAIKKLFELYDLEVDIQEQTGK